MSEDPTPQVTPPAPTEQPPAAGNTLTQEEVNKLVGNTRVEARTAFLKKHGFESEKDFETAIARAKELENAQLTELEKAQKEVERLTTEAAQARADAESARLANLRARLGREKGLPEPLIEKLVGSDEEGITAEIDALLPFVRAGADGANLGGGTNPAAAGDMGKSPDEKMAAALLRSLTGR